MQILIMINFTNKFLYEDANTPLIRNETQLDYLLTDTVKIGLKNIYVEDPVSDNILSFNIGYVWWIKKLSGILHAVNVMDFGA